MTRKSFTETKIIIFINIIREEGLDYEVKHVAFRCLYFISKVRSYKVVARHLPHETADLEPLLHYLENQDPGVQLKWDTHNGLLLWLSIVVKIPFHLQRFDTSTSKPIMEGLIFLKPRVASWRYQRGSRSLAANLQQSQPVETKAAISVNDEDDHDYDVPEEIEEALHQMTFLDPESMKLILSTQILPRCTNPELYLRHGSILASGKVISALCQVA
ncbi:hypothetical protein DAPPUDRAFT_248360 [Daphnia pulex]|uniref:Tubulin-specific chaperone D C-terminal domain-containing protein n=1 Tax=Daphnia pulex TaxID=6669 RepID=E9GU89_DAPPU|nr:hypothetical protein DAPPUDRAFT_248360 [Daphnia pulex]|eukprot:EFX77014.1 hypothetical protein DAPPUDRAFT_248360 [Daphnia pulex]